MLEAVLIMSIMYACMYMPLRGKTFEELTLAQQKRVEKAYNQYKKTKKGKQDTETSVADYLPNLQKLGKTYLIVASVLAPIYIVILVVLYPIMFR